MKKRIALIISAAMLLSGCGIINESPAASDTAASSTEASSEATEAATEAITDAPTEAPTEAETEAEKTEAPSEAVTEAAEATAAGDPATEPTEQTETPEAVPEDVFAGKYCESIAGRGIITLTNNGNGVYNVHIHWAGSAFESAEWDFSGEFDGRQVLRYSDCTKKHCVYSEDGSCTEETVYTDGTGYLKIGEDGMNVGLFWQDDIENSGADAWFVKQ
ncbi:MAG: acid shock protein [Ruminococcus sp.]|nr:acid shock protein [Ruminococcus sp.]